MPDMTESKPNYKKLESIAEVKGVNVSILKDQLKLIEEFKLAQWEEVADVNEHHVVIYSHLTLRTHTHEWRL